MTGLPRQGPRPLALHVNIAMTVLLSSPGGLPFLNDASLLWKPELRDRASALAAQVLEAERNLKTSNPGLNDSMASAVDREMRRRLGRFFTGVERYRHHPYRRTLEDPPTVWSEGGSRLLDFGHTNGAALDGRPVLFVPSLVNRAYILDLSPTRSMLRWLARQGIRPLMIDWGVPGDLERRYTLTDYIAGRLDRALDSAIALTGRPVAAVGYCMGGLLAAALALRRPRDIDALCLAATPWDFAGEDRATARLAMQFTALFGPALDLWGELPVDALQAMFAQVDPLMALRKFSQFGRLEGTSPQAENFVALEDWLNDGIPLVAAVARDCLAGWYGRNDPACGNWLVAGLPVEPQALRLPTLALVPGNDRIVPPASALALARLIPGTEIMTPPLGHIGMVVSAGARNQVWHPLADWLLANGGH
ncbi:MAG: alpha/beta fold hydrolase [Rhodospirillaceae bacterium]